MTRVGWSGRITELNCDLPEKEVTRVNRERMIWRSGRIQLNDAAAGNRGQSLSHCPRAVRAHDHDIGAYSHVGEELIQILGRDHLRADGRADNTAACERIDTDDCRASRGARCLHMQESGLSQSD